jgi:ribosomal protein S18 acetylase RimI-like enzyme
MAEPVNIIRVETESEINEARRLFLDYETFLDVDLCFQQFEAELANLPGNYAPPEGALLLALDGRISLGCGALRRLGNIMDLTCEMKRLYVRPENRGAGHGRQLARHLIREAVRLGYATMVLDTLERLAPAMALYESLGFVRTEPYYRNPLPGVVYWKLDIQAAS